MKIVPVTCPRCGDQIEGRQQASDLFFICGACGTMHMREPKVDILDHEIAAFGRDASFQRAYAPFWRARTHVRIFNEQTSGVFALFSFIGGGRSEGYVDVWIPATWSDPTTFKVWSTTLTRSPPRYTPAKDFSGVPRLPATVNRELATQLVDFIIITIEAEKPGTLQRLEYDMRVEALNPVFLPFFWTGSAYELGL